MGGDPLRHNCWEWLAETDCVSILVCWKLSCRQSFPICFLDFGLTGFQQKLGCQGCIGITPYATQNSEAASLVYGPMKEVLCLLCFGHYFSELAQVSCAFSLCFCSRLCLLARAVQKAHLLCAPWWSQKWPPSAASSSGLSALSLLSTSRLCFLILLAFSTSSLNTRLPASGTRFHSGRAKAAMWHTCLP